MIEVRIFSFVTVVALVSLPGLTVEQRFAFGCAFIGTMGQGAYQLLTVDKLKPTKKMIVGDLVISAVCGWGVYAMGGEVSQATLFFSFWSGAGASLAFWGLVKKFRPAWVLDEEAGQ